ncbi:MAG: glutathione S-transferase N-terminal domain-containing protein [Pseudomonadota bacterium]
MTITLYDLANHEDCRFSPYCWRVKMALAHKGLDVAAEATPFHKIKEIADGGFKTVPVIRDGDRLVGDSFDIAVYLEETYPDRPSLFGGPGGQAAARLIEGYANAVIMSSLVPLVVKDVHDQLHPDDRSYFKETREARIGAKFDDLHARRDDNLPGFDKALMPLRLMLKKQPFVGGDGPNFCDYIIFGTLQWKRVTSPYAALAEDDPIADWFGRCLDLHDGLGRSMPAAA